jgi:hypothetical protein
MLSSSVSIWMLLLIHHSKSLRESKYLRREWSKMAVKNGGGYSRFGDSNAIAVSDCTSNEVIAQKERKRGHRKSKRMGSKWRLVNWGGVRSESKSSSAMSASVWAQKPRSSRKSSARAWLCHVLVASGGRIDRTGRREGSRGDALLPWIAGGYVNRVRRRKAECIEPRSSILSAPRYLWLWCSSFKFSILI